MALEVSTVELPHEQLSDSYPSITQADVKTADPVSSFQEYSVLEQPSQTHRPLRVITIGAGASAINFAHEISISDLDVSLTCYDKNPEIGGTWFENRYPGCACDIPSVNYQLSWAPAVWTKYYSSAPEILAYFKKVATDHDLLKYMKLSHRVIGAIWDEDRGQWNVEVQNLVSGEILHDRCNVLINASGVLNKWKWPSIPGRETFQGTMLHSANWDTSADLTGKKVAVIGGGSSAVQIVPNLQPVVGEMTCFLRSTTWVTAGFAQRFAGPNGTNFEYTEQQKEIFKNDPVKYLKYRKCIESELNVRFRFILNGSIEQANARKFAEEDMRRRLAKKPEIGDLLVPKDYAVGCRRPTPGNGYLESLCEDNVHVVSETISEITPTGVKTADGKLHEVDAIVCATGFDVSWRPAYPTIGRDGKDLREVWKEKPSTYLSITVPDFPNYLIFNGPYGPYGHGSFLPITETLARHFMLMLRKMAGERVSSFAPTQAAVDDFAEHRRKFLPRTAWTSPCRSWFKGGTVDGEVMMWPGSRLQFFEVMRQPRWEDYDMRHCERNRFAYFGNGFATRESDGKDLSWYLGQLGEEDVQPSFTDEDLKDFIATSQ
ncbi:steroid monooxygenase [Lecanosticta acicola]|uniref:Steroid monooxygenase n=1 Tax=Lecanosticta acicola TaxID=111012 RepID=A0AAI8Z719_9PEZI|nr:steroid monooxygenase [Lecanosticta acicola]